MTGNTHAETRANDNSVQARGILLNQNGFLALGLLLAVILTYSPVLWAGYIWDDDYHLTANPCIVGPLGLKQIWTTKAADVCPLTLTTFWIEHALWGLHPLPYHLVNVLFHGICGVLLWRVLHDLKIPGSWWAAALWVLHPVGTESAAWITETKNTESTIFFLLSIGAFQKWLREHNGVKLVYNNRHYILTLIFAALAMTSKSSTVVLPLVLGLCAWWVDPKISWRIVPALVPLFFMSLAVGIVTIVTVKTQGHIPVPTIPQRLITAGDAIWFYLGTLIFPYHLNAMYPRWHINSRNWYSYLPTLCVIFTLFVLWKQRASWSRPWLFAFSYFIIALLPVLGFINHTILQYSFVFNHFQYLASMGPLAIAGAGMAAFVETGTPEHGWVRRTACIGVVLTLAVISWQRVWVYNNEEALWTDSISKNPNSSMAHFCLARAVYEKGESSRAINEYQKAEALNPFDSESYVNLGLIYFDQERSDQATEQFNRALAINPLQSKAYYALGCVSANQGLLDGAASDFSKALEINPDFAEAQSNLGAILLHQGRLDEALLHIREALRLNPNDVVALKNLSKAQALAQQEKQQAP
jgi:tetratricopeptide (TPR) repeat protein